MILHISGKQKKCTVEADAVTADDWFTVFNSPFVVQLCPESFLFVSSHYLY